MDWQATHRVDLGNGEVEVMVVGHEAPGDALVFGDVENGDAFTREEWEACDEADIEIVDGVWTFQGEPFTGPRGLRP